METKPQGNNKSKKVNTFNVEPVNSKEKRSLYKKHQKIYPKRAYGFFRHLKWWVMIVTLSIYYVSPWLRWDRGEASPNQAILIDIPENKFYFFFIEIWPEEIYYVTGLLIIASLSLFLATSIAGRVWCGYTCPQTVWTDLFLVVERFFEGDRNARILLDKKPWSISKFIKKLCKHVVWLIIAVATGGAWVFYFADAPTLFNELITFNASTIAYSCIGVLTFTTYTLGGFAREQVCTYMCPWPRIQGAMFDEHSLSVTYREQRGEPRGPLRKSQGWNSSRGDCIDCNACVVVCPMGIDIRDGLQLECINCGLCIDACNDIMDKINRPRGLIAYDSYLNIEANKKGKTIPIKILRFRTIIYSILILIAVTIMLTTFINRSDSKISIIRERNPLFVQMSDGSIQNTYLVKIANKQHIERKYRIEFTGIEKRAIIRIVGAKGNIVTVDPDSLANNKIFISIKEVKEKSTPVKIRIVPLDGGEIVEAETVFIGP